MCVVMEKLVSHNGSQFTLIGDCTADGDCNADEDCTAFSLRW